GKHEIDDLVTPAHDPSHGKVGDAAVRMRNEVEPCGTIPGAMHMDVIQVVPHELRDLWLTVDVRQQLEIDVELLDALGDVIELVGKAYVLVGHGAHGDALVIAMQRPR